ncbi:MAG TPA: transcriptional regulator GcvA [Stellaceae bacterium]|jgi:LysR family glycine cleavage system transcriptional activator|nr:transcriptional regulator GcvA [Stellaceae bacterium]
MTTSLPSLNGLRAFEAAARHRSFTRAAVELNVTQTAVSHQIRRLEEQLGVRLFTRRNRALQLTPVAESYLPAVRAAFEDLRQATERLRRRDRDELLTVSTIASLAAKWLLPRVALFQETHPGIEVRLTASTHLVDFRREEVDMAVRYGRGHWPGLRADWLMAEDIFPVCSPALLSGEKPLREPKDLVHHTLLHATLAREDWQLWLTAAGLPTGLAAKRGLTFDQSFMAIQAAIEGHGVALGRTPIVEADIAAGRLVVPFDLVLPAEAGYYVVAPEETANAPKIALFRDWLLASVANTPHPNPPPQGGRGLRQSPEASPSPLEGEGRGGG